MCSGGFWDFTSDLSRKDTAYTTLALGVHTDTTYFSNPAGLQLFHLALLVIVENYPQLRSSESFQKFQDELAGTENRIATARKDYNDAVQDYNTTRAKFPTVISAKLFGFKEEPFFKADEAAKQVPKIDANSLRPNQNSGEKK